MTNLIIKSNIRKKLKELDPKEEVNNVAEEVEDALNQKVEEILKRAIERAKANQRKTIFARDL